MRESNQILLGVALVSLMWMASILLIPQIPYELHYETTIPINPPEGATHIKLHLKQYDIKPLRRTSLLHEEEYPKLIDDGEIKPIRRKTVTVTLLVDKDFAQPTIGVDVEPHHGYVEVECVYYRKVGSTYLELGRETYIIEVECHG